MIELVLVLVLFTIHDWENYSIAPGSAVICNFEDEDEDEDD
jgi:hypothetical protein